MVKDKMVGPYSKEDLANLLGIRVPEVENLLVVGGSKGWCRKGARGWFVKGRIIEEWLQKKSYSE
jgi:hypothetical protein